MRSCFIKEPLEYFEIMTDPSKVVHSVTILNDQMLLLSYTEKDEFVESLETTNVVIAAFTTSIARLHLYSYIEKLGERLLYFDTDSLIYVSHQNDQVEYKVPLGTFLGDMTNELKSYGEGSFIKEFISAGPKNYSLKIYSVLTDQFQYLTKIRGFTLDSVASTKLNFKSLKRNVLDYVKENYVHETNLIFNQIVRTNTRDVLTKLVQKRYRILYDKRVLCRDGSTLPYGW